MCLFLSIGGIFLMVLGFELRDLYLVGRHSSTWAMLPALFALVILEGLTFCPGCLDNDLPILDFLSSLGWQAWAPHPAFTYWNEVSQTFAQAGLELWSTWSQPPSC
jgi:hypothetical protein